jgi:predicted  nucleic acid-binding Zn-ribbon protein
MQLDYFSMGKSLSETVRLSQKDIRGWLEKETGSTFTPVHSKARKLLDDMRKNLESLSEASKMLLDNSAKEIEKRNMRVYGRARALNKIARLFVDRVHGIEVPEQANFNTLDDFVQRTGKAFAVTEMDVANWFPRISPFFILDRRKFLAVFEKSKSSLDSFQNFLSKDYVKTKMLEDTFRLIDDVAARKQEAATLESMKARIESDKASTEREIAQIQQKMADLRNKGGMSQLHQTTTEIDALSAEVKHSLQQLQKPFIKLVSLSTHGGGSGLTPEELNKLRQYIENPFEAFGTETPDAPILKEVVKKLQRSISDGKLKLKPEKVRKAEQTIDSIVNKDSLVSLQEKCRDAMMRKVQLSLSTEIEATRQDLFKLQEYVEYLGRKKGITETEQETVQKKIDDNLKTISTDKSEIEKNISGFLGKKVHLD